MGMQAEVTEEAGARPWRNLCVTFRNLVLDCRCDEESGTTSRVSEPDSCL